MGKDKKKKFMVDLKSYSRWDDYTKARDQMFAATDTAWAPCSWRNRTTRGARLNIITHLLSKVLYQEAPREKVVF